MSKRRLLLADDSVTIQKVVNLTFADEGIEVISVGNGDIAMEKIAESRPDVVLADVNMPGLNGYEICERLRADEATRRLPVILLVGSFEPFDEDEANRVGADAFLTKPFQSIRQLVTKVSELMESTKGVSDEAVEPEPPDDSPDEEATHPWIAATSSDEPETDDIDHLYKESFVETAETPRAEIVKDVYADAGMDDEMIETTYSSAGARVGSEGGEEQSSSPFRETVSDYRSAAVATPAVVSKAVAFEPNDSENRSGETDFVLGDVDLLELPPPLRQTLRVASPGENISGAEQIVTLSPQLLDEIVQRVVEKLAQNR